jgi:hypothetical protein
MHLTIFISLALLLSMTNTQTPEERATTIVGNMTMAEKISLLHGIFGDTLGIYASKLLEVSID